MTAVTRTTGAEPHSFGGAMNARRMLVALAALSLAAAEVQSQPASRARSKQPAATEKAGWRTSLSRAEIEQIGGGDVHSVQFFTRHAGWAVGRGTATMLLRTTDGGQSWERSSLLDGGSHGTILNAIRFFDVNHGWIVGRRALLRTTDAGESWEPVSGVAFFEGKVLLPLSPDVVMVAAEKGQIWLTSADGASVRNVGTVPNGEVSGLAFVAPNTFYASVGTAHGRSGAIHRSTDGGATWEPVVEGDKPVLAIAFHDHLRGVATGVGVAYYTVDGGETWKRVLAAGRRHAVAFINENTVVSTGRSPEVTISNDGGRSWRPLSSPVTGPTGQLVDIAVVDGGWWFVAGGYGARAIYQYVDPGFVDAIAEGIVPIPGTIKLPGGRRLPAGMYEVTLEHRGEEHTITLDRTGDVVPDTSAGGEAVAFDTTSWRTDSAAAVDPAKCSPCEATLPVEVEYRVEEFGVQGKTRPRFRLSLEPTATGVAIVVDAAINPPRDAAVALAALGAQDNQEIDANAAARKVGQATKKPGGLMGRLKKAAEGDVRGAAAGIAVNPQAAASRVKSARASAPTTYRVKMRYTLEVFRPKKTERSGSGR